MQNAHELILKSYLVQHQSTVIFSISNQKQISPQTNPQMFSCKTIQTNLLNIINFPICKRMTWQVVENEKINNKVK